MATTKIWSVHGRIGDVIGYAENPDKTANPDFAPSDLQALRDVMNYATNDFKTERQFYVTGLNCVPEIARGQMVLTKRRFGKEDGIVAFHAYQSFAPGEVTPDEAHALGVALAQKLWGHRFEVIVATHLNTHCCHNHFVLNSVSFLDGGKYNDSKAAYRRLRQTSDRLCRTHGLSVIEDPQTDRASYAALRHCYFPKDLPLELRRMGYEVKTNVKYMAVRPQGRPRFVRLKTLGEDYTAHAIEGRIMAQRALGYEKRSPTPLPIPRHYRLKGACRHVRKATGLRALYFHYCYLLGVFPKHPPQKLSFAMRQELGKLDQIIAQGKLLTRYRIDTVEQLSSFQTEKGEAIAALLSRRNAVVSRLRRCKDEPKEAALKGERRALTEEITLFRRELKLARQIDRRMEEMQHNLRPEPQKTIPPKQIKPRERELSR